MTQYLRQNDTYHLAPDVSGVAIDSLPAGFYRLCFHDKLGFYLQITNPLTLIPKAYGNAYQHQDRIMETFNERTEIPTTIMLEGFKGTGKTLLAKKLCVDFVKSGGICILQSEAYVGDDYKGFLQKINQQKIVFIDEFDKVYTRPEQVNDMLTLLDGMYPMHTLFILTMNADSRSSRYEYFHNRPGRVYYNIHFGSISESTIREYANDVLINKDRIDEILEYVGRFSMFNMDMLTILIKEINKSEGQNISVRDLGKFLNIKPTISYDDIRLQKEATYKGYDVSDSFDFTYFDADYIERMMTDDTFEFRLMIRPNGFRKTDDGKLWEDENGDAKQCIGFMAEDKFIELEPYHRIVKPNDVKCEFDPKTRVFTLTDKEHDVVVTVQASPTFSHLNKDERVVNF
ncbi:hypothetical protein APD40_05565 [Acinetobacter baumannii]|uniref:AAA family ATPase n=1 Tax=Acinetobacter baumannii TaxID=470 RepID=UPI0007106150|nr:AAA family ATPase [Acinetobacter baumannii]KRI27536.1 hypothetical protein APD40_05565 [Acinetobacter baumannii]